MFLVEVVLQGVRGFRELVRLRFKSGYNLVVAGNESGKTTTADAIVRLLFPRNETEILKSVISRHVPDASRAALVICSDDGVYYRMIQDFSKRAVNLSQYNPTKKDFGLLHKDWENAMQFMAGVTAGMSEEDFARIFLFQRELQTARTGAPTAAATLRPVPSTTGPTQGVRSSADSERLAELQESLRKAEEAADAEYKYQSAKLALDEIEKKISSLEEIERQQAANRATLESLKGFESLPEDLAVLIEDYERRQGQKLIDADDLNKQLNGIGTQLASLPTINFMKDILFLSGIVMIVISILAGVFVLTEDLKIFFPVGLLLSLMLLAGSWYKESRLAMKRKKLLREEDSLKKDLDELEKRFQREGADITAALRSTGASSPAELKEKAENYRYFLSLGADLEEQRQRNLGDMTLETLQKQRGQRQQEAAALGEAAQAVAQNNIDTYSIRQDIERLTAESSAASVGASWDFGTEHQEPTAFSPNPDAGEGRSGFLEELSIASRIGGIEMETLVPAVEAAAQRHLSAITAGKYVRFEAGHDSGPIVHTKDDSVVDYSALSHGARSLIYFCFRTGLVEALSGKRRFPFILDDPLTDFDPARQKAACHVLRALGAKTQVILFSSNSALKAEGDASVELK